MAPAAVVVVVIDEIRKGNKAMDNTVTALLKQKDQYSSSTRPSYYPSPYCSS